MGLPPFGRLQDSSSAFTTAMTEERNIDEAVRARLLAIKVSHDSVSLASTPSGGQSAPGSPFSPSLYASGSGSRYVAIAFISAMLGRSCSHPVTQVTWCPPPAGA
jgi:hypothetical protein